MTDSQFALIHFQLSAVQEEFHPGFASGSTISIPLARRTRGLGLRNWLFGSTLKYKVQVIKLSQAKGTLVSPHTCGQAAQLSLPKNKGMEITAVKSTASPNSPSSPCYCQHRA